jgi:hypothetical protein
MGEAHEFYRPIGQDMTKLHNRSTPSVSVKSGCRTSGLDGKVAR